MKAIFPALLVACLASFSAEAQTTDPTLPYGKINKADLELKECDFEKDANAMVLFEKGDLYYDQQFNIVLETHKRVKIFNDNGKDEANIKIDYDGGNRYEYLSDVQAETFNLNGDKIEITKVDKKQMFNQTIDKVSNQYVFSFPNVKAGSVIEYKYRRVINSYSHIPRWYFQGSIPIKYIEYDTAIPDFLFFNVQGHIFRPFVKNKTSAQSKMLDSFGYSDNISQMALANVPSLPTEPYMTAGVDNLESIAYQLTSISPLVTGKFASVIDSWDKVGEILADDEDFGGQLKRKLTNEDAIIAKAKALKTDDQKIAYLFGEVKNNLKWNGIDEWYTIDGTRAAWDKKTGNSAEVNIILYHLLKQAGVNAYPMVVSTRKHGKVNPAYPFLYQFNRAVVYVPIDSTKNYIMDATSKYNVYNEIPDNLLNSSGLLVDKENKNYKTIFLEKTNSINKIVFVNAEITADGQMGGTASIKSYSYNRINSIKDYQTDGEKKYIDNLIEHDNNLKVFSLKMEDMGVDSLPLTQNMQFKEVLTGSDANYIYFSPNLFTALHNNPFLNENRLTNIDFGYQNAISVSGVYKLPQGYHIDALPKSVNMVMPDRSITFKRIIGEQNGTVIVRYVIDFKKSIYFKEDYPDIHEFYKKMQEMLNEQVVLKKS